MSLSEEIRVAVAVALEDLLPKTIGPAVRSAVADLELGDPGDVLVDAREASRILGTTPAALRRAVERGRALVAPIERMPGRRSALRWRRRDLLARVHAASVAEAS